MNFVPKYKYSNPHIWNSFFWYIISDIQLFYIRLHIPVHITAIFFLISDFLAERLKTNKNYRKRSLTLQYNFTQKTSLILWTSMTLKIICSHNIAKNPFHFTNFPANMFLFGVGKNIFRNGAVPFLDTQQLYSWSTLKANACVFLYISVRKFLFDRSSKILYGGGWGVVVAEWFP